MHAGHPYSLPPDAIGLPGTLYLYRDRVRIIAGRFSAEPARLFQSGASSILPAHRAQRVAAVSGKRARRSVQRQHLIDLGAPALAYLTELTHRRPRTGIPEVDIDDFNCTYQSSLRLQMLGSALSPDVVTEGL